MIKLATLMEGKYDYGCVMAKVDESFASKLLEFNNQYISEEHLYLEEGHDYGRECEPHTTVKYGLVNSYSKEQMSEILKNTSPFNIQVRGISIFENDKFDVVKFSVSSPELSKLNEVFSKLPNHDEYPEYKPHMTLAYVKKGMGKKFVRETKKIARIPINSIVYSDRGNKSCFKLSETSGNSQLDLINQQIADLDKKWDILDTSGNREMEQHDISKQLEKLYAIKAKLEKKHRWDILRQVVKNTPEWKTSNGNL